MRMASRLDRAGSVLVYCHHIIVVAVGAFGLIEEPSPSVTAVVGGFLAAYLWSVMFLVFGMLALACRVAQRHGIRWKGKRYKLDTTRSEALCIALIGVGMFLFSAMITSAALFGPTEPPPPGPPDSIPGTPGSIQTALAILSSSVFLPGVAAISLAQTRVERLKGTASTVSQQVLHELAREARRTTEGD